MRNAGAHCEASGCLHRCCCGAEACVGFLGAHARSFREHLEEEAARCKMWADQDGLHYAVKAPFSLLSMHALRCVPSALQHALCTCPWGLASMSHAHAPIHTVQSALLNVICCRGCHGARSGLKRLRFLLVPQMDLALDTYSSEDEAAREAAPEDGSISLSGLVAQSRDRAAQQESSRPGKRAKPRRARANWKAAGGARRGRQGSPRRSTSAGIADELELDKEFVVGARGAHVDGSSNPAAGGWESCAAGTIRLLARMQAHASLQAQHAGLQEGADAHEDGPVVLAHTSRALQGSMLAVDDLLRAFEDTHARLGRFSKSSL